MNQSVPEDSNSIHQRIESLSPEKRLLLARLQQKKAVKSGFEISPRGSDRHLPLSLEQERLWFLHQLDPDNPGYNIVIAWRIRGNLDVCALQQSLQLIIARHESLRTAFVCREGKPYQEIISISDCQRQFKITIIDLQGLPSPQQELELQHLTRQEAGQGFDLLQAPLLRVKLICLGVDRYTLLLTLHHIIADGWSRGILLREFAQNYRGLITQEQISLPELPIQFADFALWQRQWLEGEEMRSQLAYWQTQLADLPMLELPTDFPRQRRSRFSGRTEFTLLPLGLLESLKGLSQQRGVTLFMLLLAAFKVLLHRYCQQDEIVLSVPSANRDRAELQGLIGFFVNTLVLRTNLSGNPNFTTVVERVRATVGGAFRHQNIPFAKLVDVLQPERDLSHNPLVQVMFQVQNQAYQLQNELNPELDLPNLQIEQTWVDSGATKFDLSVHLIERKNGLLFAVEYCTDLFEQQTILRMMQHFQVLLQGVIVNPGQRISELPILTESERYLILEKWQQTQIIPLEKIKLVHQRFEEQVQQTPDNIAVIWEGKEIRSSQHQLTYQELNIRANQLAYYLRSLGIGAESLVGIYLERTPELIIALLGVFKAGGAYLPLERKLPRERIEYIIHDAQPVIVLTMTGFVDDLPQLQGRVICVDLDLDLNSFPGNQNPVNLVVPENQAYVIYTSGSTGTPKGTILTHRGLANYLNYAVTTYPVARGMGGVPVQSSISFDATITSLYTPLLVGKPVVLFSENDEIAALTTALNSGRDFGIIKLTPAHLSILNQLLPPQELSGYPQALIIGGEALSEQQLEYWRNYAPQTRLINEYGPTETVVGCCIYDATPKPISQDYPQISVPIGRPIFNTQIYILDRYLQPVPIGIPGELYIGGAGVARGYLNRPDLTAEKFIPNPFIIRRSAEIDHSSSTLYKTGDKAKYLPDGAIAYLGRLDHQVKIRGFRVELAEVTAVLESHPDVKTAVVVLRHDNLNHPRLVAYVVGTPNGSHSPSAELRSHLGSKLPTYMIPAAFIWLEQLPLTTNGKVDLQKLPPPEIEVSPNQIAPRTDMEAKLVSILTELLGVSVGITDNFFGLGGDSILAIQFVAKANQVGIRFTPQQLFQHQTIAELVQVVQTSPGTGRPTKIVTGKVPLTPIQHWLFMQNLHNPHHYNQAVLLEVEANLQIPQLQEALQQLLQHHDGLRSRFHLEAGKWQQHIDLPSDSFQPLTVIDLQGIPQPEDRLRSLASQFQASLDLERGNLWRVVLFRLGNGNRDRLLFIAHHLITDAVSWRILAEDLVIAYHQGQLPPKTTSFAEWSENLTNYAHSEQITTQLQTWLQILPPDFPPLPLDQIQGNPIAVNTIASETEITVHLDVNQTTTLVQAANKAYNTRTHDLLITTLVETICQWTQHPALLLDLEAHGRENIFPHLDLSRTVGWFTSIFPVYLQIHPSGNLGDKIKSIKEQLRQIPHNGISYGLLRYLNYHQTQSQTLQKLPQSAISFNYLGKLDVFPSHSWIKQIATESVGAVNSLANQRSHVINVTVWQSNQELTVQWRYSRNLHHAATIQNLADGFIRNLRALIHHCQSPTNKGYTPSDFAAARLNQQQLDKFLNQLQKPKQR